MKIYKGNFQQLDAKNKQIKGLVPKETLMLYPGGRERISYIKWVDKGPTAIVR